MIGAVRRWLRQRRVERWRARGSPEDPALARYLATFAPLDLRTPLDEARFVVVDTETTGLDIENDRILTLAAVAVDRRRLQPGHSLDVVVAHDQVGAAAAPIHGLVRADLAEGVDEVTMLGRFLALLGNAVFVAHHAAFDEGIVGAALRRHGAPPLLNDVLCTEVLARRLVLGPFPRETSERFPLDAAADRYRLETEARHTAAGDALLTAELLLRLLSDARRAGLRTLRDLLP
ncbi:MAG: 3'-5' exonuclease [Myxococcota bacterium]